ncbi:hypothetical protein [Peribacillus frigoritolerans]|uniref:hypothetical protein n=1 Tax=Peribacillus frigoritolerans TaxID=450367 RepID=UPI002E1AD87C|nr:hypothetical protein [Peribacillus frigoritolerans]
MCQNTIRSCFLGSFQIFGFLYLLLLHCSWAGSVVYYGKKYRVRKNAGIVSVLGVSLGGSVHVLAGAIGVTAILMTSATAFNIVKYLGFV